MSALGEAGVQLIQGGAKAAQYVGRARKDEKHIVPGQSRLTGMKRADLECAVTQASTHLEKEEDPHTPYSAKPWNVVRQKRVIEEAKLLLSDGDTVSTNATRALLSSALNDNAVEHGKGHRALEKAKRAFHGGSRQVGNAAVGEPSMGSETLETYGGLYDAATTMVISSDKDFVADMSASYIPEPGATDSRSRESGSSGGMLNDEWPGLSYGSQGYDSNRLDRYDTSNAQQGLARATHHSSMYPTSQPTARQGSHSSPSTFNKGGGPEANRREPRTDGGRSSMSNLRGNSSSAHTLGIPGWSGISTSTADPSSASASRSPPRSLGSRNANPPSTRYRPGDCLNILTEDDFEERLGI